MAFFTAPYFLSRGEIKVIIKSMSGFLVLMLIVFILNFFYRILPNRGAYKQIYLNFYDYFKQIILSNIKPLKIALAITAILSVGLLFHFQNYISYIIEDIFCLVNFFLLVMVFSPQKDLSKKGFPFEIFGFIYFLIFMFYSAGLLVFDTFYNVEFSRDDMWIYGYGITIISYIICIATLRGFMERRLVPEEIVFLGMIMLVTLEFITYYGIGFFGGIEWYNPSAYDNNMFGDITTIINQGVFLTSQNQILDKSTKEIWGYIILNGTDVLTITAVLGYVVQKFMEK